jgi:hypothetical protein
MFLPRVDRPIALGESYAFIHSVHMMVYLDFTRLHIYSFGHNKDMSARAGLMQELFTGYFAAFNMSAKSRVTIMLHSSTQLEVL